ncbi:hypothetical protein C7212DRAFT_335683 [Tuber magnatum]|uniref:Secreted protein n=1 Tax=Tuber magnatum TaxID=42249 RepID=A0A317SCK6_9PEZI|nr:hypothetical protein C7212DRAFT_335683 [Tuber magnatum]
MWGFVSSSALGVTTRVLGVPCCAHAGTNTADDILAPVRFTFFISSHRTLVLSAVLKSCLENSHGRIGVCRLRYHVTGIIQALVRRAHPDWYAPPGLYSSVERGERTSAKGGAFAKMGKHWWRVLYRYRGTVPVLKF